MICLLNLFIISIILFKKKYIVITFFLILSSAIIIKNSFNDKIDKFNIILFLLVLVPALVYSVNINSISGDYNINDVEKIQGKICQDSTINAYGNSIYVVKTNVISNNNSNQKTSKLLKVSVGNTSIRGMYGDVFEFNGIKYNKKYNLYIAEDCKIIHRGMLANLRAKFLVFAENRIMKINKYFRDDCDVLSKALCLKLLFARNDFSSEDVIQNYLRKTGMSFIVALSGMHLSVIFALIKYVLEKHFSRKNSLIINFIFVSIYFFLASRNSSFIRAYIAMVCSLFLTSRINLLLPLTFIFQIIFFLDSTVSMSFDFSYFAIAGIYNLNNLISMVFGFIFSKKCARYFSLSISAFIFSGIYNLINFGEFKILSIFFAPIISLIASIFIVFGFAHLFFPGKWILALISRYLYLIFKKVLSFLTIFSFDLGVYGYICMLLTMIMLVFILLLRKANTERQNIERFLQN